MTDEPEDRELVHLEMGLRAFSEEPQCSKCGSKVIQTTWHVGLILQAEPSYPCEIWTYAELVTGPISEHLCRVCLTCGYGWPERTADA
jgi:hypothetical protein